MGARAGLVCVLWSGLVEGSEAVRPLLPATNAWPWSWIRVFLAHQSKSIAVILRTGFPCGTLQTEEGHGTGRYQALSNEKARVVHTVHTCG